MATKHLGGGSDRSAASQGRDLADRSTSYTGGGGDTPLLRIGQHGDPDFPPRRPISQTRMADDQPRDDHGRFGSGSGGSSYHDKQAAASKAMNEATNAERPMSMKAQGFISKDEFKAAIDANKSAAAAHKEASAAATNASDAQHHDKQAKYHSDRAKRLEKAEKENAAIADRLAKAKDASK